MHKVRVYRVDESGQEVEIVTTLAQAPDSLAHPGPLGDSDHARRRAAETSGLTLQQTEGSTGGGVGVAVGAGRPPTRVEAPNALRRKLAWAVGSVWGVPYWRYDSWPAEYARRAAERLVEIHGAP